MAITSRGYGNDEIGEVEWSQMAGHIGVPYTYSGPDALRPYSAIGLDRGVALGNGRTFGWGVMDTLVNEQVQLPTVSSGTATYMVAVRREWGSGKRVTSTVALLMSGALPTGRNTTPGTADDQPVCLATVVSGSPVVTNIIDLRAHAAKAFYVSNLNAASMDPQLGARYVLPSGDRYIAMLSGANTIQIVREKDPDPQIIPPIPRVARGIFTDTTFSATGAATVYHNLGYTPGTFIVVPRLAASSPGITLAVSSQPGPVTSTYAVITAKRMSGGSDGWVPYNSGVQTIDWLAVG